MDDWLKAEADLRGHECRREQSSRSRRHLYSYADSLTLNRGKHHLKGGVDLRRNMYNTRIEQNH